jgi:hypothetical protein
MAAAAIPVAVGIANAARILAPIIARVLAATAAGLVGKSAADQMAKAKEAAKARTKSVPKTETCKTCPCKRTVVISRSLSPKAAQHIVDAQAAGQPKTLTYEPFGAIARGRQAVRKLPTKDGYDRDEYPPKTFAEGGATASVRYVPSSDNRSAGGQMTSQLAGATPGCRVTMKVGP